jgi:hypothetical protein
VARETRPVASRCGVIATSAVSTRTTLLLARFRYHLKTAGVKAETILCEEIVPLAFTGAADAPQRLSAEDSERLLAARPGRNLIPSAIEQQIGLLLASLPKLQAAWSPVASKRAAAQLAAHERVREAARARGRVTLQPVLPVDFLGA